MMNPRCSLYCAKILVTRSTDFNCTKLTSSISNAEKASEVSCNTVASGSAKMEIKCARCVKTTPILAPNTFATFRPLLLAFIVDEGVAADALALVLLAGVFFLPFAGRLSSSSSSSLSSPPRCTFHKLAS